MFLTMKRFTYILFLLLPFGVCAQDMYNAIPLFESDLTGTARFIGMGGSMGSLGGDISVMATNPAGIGLYRRNDASFTASYDYIDNKAKFNGEITNAGTNDFTIKNGGLVFSCNIGDDNLKYINVGLGYRNRNNISGKLDVYNPSADGFSQQYVMAELYNNRKFAWNNLSYSMYDGMYNSWLPLLGAEARLADDKGNFLTKPDGTLVWTPTYYGYYSEESGGVDEFDLNLAMNFSDRLYIGATVGVQNVDYARYSCYDEGDDIGELYAIENRYRMKGQGIDIKIGAIFRPFKYSPFKLGLAFHTPTWFEFDEYSSASISDMDGKVIDTRDYELYNGDVILRSKLATPMRLNASMSYTFGTYLAVNAEYEYADFSTGKFSGASSVAKAQNEEIGYNMKEQHTARVGAELNLDGFAIRAGYNFSTSPFCSDAYKNMFNAAVTSTSTEFQNRLEKEVITAGCGYRGKNFYFDVAYMLQRQGSDFSPFYDSEYVNPTARVVNNTQSIVGTIGMRF